MIGIYIITNNLDGKCYIGKSKDIYHRFEEHKSMIQNRTNLHLKRAIIKYGIENFTFKVLEECTEDKLNEREKFWISYYDSYNNGYNMTRGGDGGSRDWTDDQKQKLSLTISGKNHPNYGKSPSKETRDKLSNSLKKYYQNNNSKLKGTHLSDETRNKISHSLKGKSTWNKGKNYNKYQLQSITDGQHRRRQREADNNIHFHHTIETRKRISNAKTGMKFSDDHKKHIKESMQKRNLTGKNNPFYGKHHTEETKKKLSESSKNRKHQSCSENTKEILRKSASGRKYINDGIHIKAVKPEYLDEYLSRGWVLGRKIIKRS